MRSSQTRAYPRAFELWAGLKLQFQGRILALKSERSTPVSAEAGANFGIWLHRRVMRCDRPKLSARNSKHRLIPLIALVTVESTPHSDTIGWRPGRG